MADEPVVHLMNVDADNDIFSQCCRYNWRMLIAVGLVTADPALATCPGRDPDPRPAIAAMLTDEMWAKLKRGPNALYILNTEIPEGSPWAAEWEPVPEENHHVLSRITAGGAQAWLRRHSEVMEAEGIEL